MIVRCKLDLALLAMLTLFALPSPAFAKSKFRDIKVPNSNGLDETLHITAHFRDEHKVLFARVLKKFPIPELPMVEFRRDEDYYLNCSNQTVARRSFSVRDRNGSMLGYKTIHNENDLVWTKFEKGSFGEYASIGCSM